jgi:hypothetical protein
MLTIKIERSFYTPYLFYFSLLLKILQIRNQCGCGDIYDVPETEETCHIKCSVSAEYCGGIHAVNVYSTAIGIRA